MLLLTYTYYTYIIQLYLFNLSPNIYVYIFFLVSTNITFILSSNILFYYKLSELTRVVVYAFFEIKPPSKELKISFLSNHYFLLSKKKKKKGFWCYNIFLKPPGIVLLVLKLKKLRIPDVLSPRTVVFGLREKYNYDFCVRFRWHGYSYD